MEWVGTERGLDSPFLHPPRCHRACDFHRTRRPHERISGVGVPLISADFTAFVPYAAPSVECYFAHLSRCGPSPRTRLSRAQSTIATLTPFRRIGGFLGLFPTPYCRSPDHRLKGLPCSHEWTQTRSRRWWLPDNLSPPIAAPEWAQGRSGSSVPSFGRLREPKPSRSVRSFLHRPYTTR